ncbi:hypothetical protein QJS10_CPA06g00382 [Acorus calamus]|uniref:Thioredoxin domain-containing protein n=1 Tax=Acorus calamus TaxID=4465 RepID=A0AAV9EML5_ACOCL|nr:hypothetical protein QJS10_CPA06g00382 [Acorus calamus]
MAAVLESLPAPRASLFRRSSPPSASAMLAVAPSSVSVSSDGRRGRAIFPEIRGLRIGVRHPRIASAAISRRPVPVRGRIVSEAQKTAIEVPDVTKSTWQSLVMEGDLVLVEFWAPWCGPCRMIHPTISELSKNIRAN